MGLRNRRFRHDHVLDVKVATRPARRARWRLAGMALLVSVLTLSGLFLCGQAGQWTLNQLLYENDLFAIRLIEIQTDGIIPLEQLRKWSQVKKGDNLWMLDLGRIERELELVPLIKRVALERVPPHTLKIRVTEREPFARVNAFRLQPNDGGYDMVTFYIDDDGYVMPPATSWLPANSSPPPNDSLPVLMGVESTELRQGKQVVSPQIFAALRLITNFEESVMFGLDELSSIDLSAPELLQVTTRAGSQITLGVDHLEDQLRRWRIIYDYGTNLGKGILALDLSVTNNLPVRWQTADTVSPAPAKILKPTRYRKKHV
jgi:cell division septal protein FtsQ